MLTTTNLVLSVDLTGLTLFEVMLGGSMTDDLASVYLLETPVPAVSLVVRALYEGTRDRHRLHVHLLLRFHRVRRVRQGGQTAQPSRTEA